MTTVCLVGSTGLVGSRILSTLTASAAIPSVYAYTRHEPNKSTSNSKINHIPSSDSSAWPGLYPRNTEIFFSALGTTARAAGSFANQRKIDFDLNIALAKAAKEAGATIYVLISTSGASPTSMIPYSKMKGELDEAVKAIGFAHTVILKPGLLVGARNDSRPGEFAARKVASLLGAVSGNKLKDSWAQDAEVVARAAVKAGLRAAKGEYSEAVTVLGQSDIVRLGRTEWADGT